MTKDGRVVHDTALEDSPKCMEVSGDEKFVLVQKLGLKAPRKEEASACTCDANGAGMNRVNTTRRKIYLTWKDRGDLHFLGKNCLVTLITC